MKCLSLAYKGKVGLTWDDCFAGLPMTKLGLHKSRWDRTICGRGGEDRSLLMIKPRKGRRTYVSSCLFWTLCTPESLECLYDLAGGLSHLSLKESWVDQLKATKRTIAPPNLAIRWYAGRACSHRGKICGCKKKWSKELLWCEAQCERKKHNYFYSVVRLKYMTVYYGGNVEQRQKTGLCYGELTF